MKLPDYKTFPGTIANDAAKDSFYTGGFLAKWREDAVAAIVHHQMGDRDSYPGQYIWMFCNNGVLLWAEVDEACLNFLEAWGKLPDVERNDKNWWAPLEEVIALVKHCPKTSVWVKANKLALLEFPHLAPHCHEHFVREVRTAIGELDWSTGKPIEVKP